MPPLYLPDPIPALSSGALERCCSRVGTPASERIRWGGETSSHPDITPVSKHQFSARLITPCLGRKSLVIRLIKDQEMEYEQRKRSGPPPDRGGLRI